jgi:hypothetical protein
LSATNIYRVMVNPLAQPVSASISAPSAGSVSLVASGASGPDYTLLTSTNLIDWQILVTTNSPATPVTLTHTDPDAASTRFYRIQLGP